MPDRRNTCVDILKVMQDNESRQTQLRTRIITEAPVVVVVLVFSRPKIHHRFVSTGEARCNGTDRFSVVQGFNMASKRAMRQMAGNKKARDSIIEFKWLLCKWGDI